MNITGILVDHLTSALEDEERPVLVTPKETILSYIGQEQVQATLPIVFLCQEQNSVSMYKRKIS